MSIQRAISQILGVTALSFASQAAFATCSDISWQNLSDAVAHVKSSDKALTNGLGNNMWATMVDQTGKVCHVVNSAGPGQRSGQTWALSRVISAEKANTSNGLSLQGQPWSTAMVYAATQPGGFLWGVQFANLLDSSQAYAGAPTAYGTENDPLVNKRIGGMIVFGGGLPLYRDGVKIGAIGVSGDTSCTDHAYAWRVRIALANAGLVTLKPGAQGDEMTLDQPGNPGHPLCPAMPVIDPVETGIFHVL